MSIHTQRFGELYLAFTDQFEPLWNDSGSGASQDGAFWHPVPPPGFKTLGSVGVNHYGDINHTVAAMCVKEVDEDSGNPALKQPTGYDLIWKDSGSGAHEDGSCWRPKAPHGYVALGDVFVRGYNTPKLDDVVCVRADLAYQADIGNEIWADHKSGAHADFECYHVDTPEAYLDASKGLFAVNSLVGNNKYDKPRGAAVLHCLNLPFPVEEQPDPAYPSLTSFNPPPSSTTPSLDRSVLVPFTAIHDDAKDTSWKVSQSPFYRVERYVSYRTEMHDNNQTSSVQTVKELVTTGISKSSSSTFSKTTGISVTAESGVSFLGSGGKVSATVSVELGWSRTTGINEFSQTTVEKSIVVQPKTAQALWATSYELVVKRADSSILPSKLTFEVDYFVHSEFPEGKTSVELPAKRIELAKRENSH